MRPLLIRLAAGACAGAIEVLVRLVTAVRADWNGVGPVPGLRVYYANHAGANLHGGANLHAGAHDFILIWTVLPPRLRAGVRPVARADYWLAGRLRSFVARRVFDVLPVECSGPGRRAAPVERMTQALDAGRSLILFPEGPRDRTDRALPPFRTGLYHLAAARPDVDFVPVWIDNLNRVLPRGRAVPIPLLCRVRFGAPLRLRPDERRDAFLMRSRDALLDLSRAGTA